MKTAETPLIHLPGNSVDEICIFDADSLKFLYANTATITNSEYSLKELKNLTLVEFFPEYSRDEMLKLLAELSRDKGSNTSNVEETWLRSKSGNISPVKATLQAVDYKGAAAYAVHIQDTSRSRKLLDQLSLVIEGSALGYWDMNHRTGSYTVNDGWLLMLGIERSEFTGDFRHYREIVHPDDLPALVDALALTLEIGRTDPIEFRMRHKAGHWIWIKSTGSVVERDPVTHEALRVCGIHENISVRKAGEAERQLLLDRLESQEYCLNQHSIVSMTDTQGNIIYCNEKFCEISAYSEEELLGQNHRIIKSDQHSTEFYGQMWNAISNGQVWQGEICNLNRGGEPYWVASTIVPILDKQGGIDHYTAILTDITDRKLAEARLKDRQALLNETGQLAKVGGWELRVESDRRSYDVIWTDQTYHIHELPIGSGTPLEETINYFHPDDRPRVQSAIQEALDQGKSFEFELRLITAKGRHIWVHSIGKPIIKNGKTVKIVGAIQDITERRNAEEQLRKMRKMESIGILAGGIAHDFNNILTALFGNISVVKNLLDKDHPAYALSEKAEQAIERATNLTTQLLTFSQGGDPIKKVTDITELIQQVVQFDLAGSKVKPVFEFEENLWRADIDFGQIEQVFSNLTMNANQAMPDGGSLHITVKNSREGAYGDPSSHRLNKWLKIIFRDEGHGISPDILERIFEPYFTTKEEGRGLGLATVYSIIGKHECGIRIDSTEGVGTTFTFFLPATVSEVETRRENLSSAELDVTRGEKILIMDDNESVREVTARMLSSKGYSVDAAEDGQQAVNMYRESLAQGKGFDCVIMDLTIPGGIGGKDAVKAVLAINPDAKVIVASGYASDSIMADYRNYGFKGVVAKPFTINELCTTVQRVIDAE